MITAVVAGTAYTFKKLYPTAASRAALASTGGGNPALRFLYGRLDGSSLGSLTTWRYGVWAGIFAALLAIFVVIRHTRSDEEAGRLELIGSAVVGRQAALAAGLADRGHGQRRGGRAAVPGAAVHRPAGRRLGRARAGHRLLRAGVHRDRRRGRPADLRARAPRAGSPSAALGVAFVLRGVGDSAGAGGPSWLSWASPLGWIQLARPFAAERWWVLGLPLAAAAVGTGLAFEFAARRDQGAGLLPDRPGRPAASAFLRGPFGLAWRLQRGVAGWAGPSATRSPSPPRARRPRASASCSAPAPPWSASSPGSAASRPSPTPTWPP